MLSSTTSSKMKFPHDTTQIIFFNTYFLQGQLLYVVQCNSKTLYVGKATYEFILYSQHSIAQQVTAVCASSTKFKIYFGTSDGKIYYLCQKEQKQLKALYTEVGNAIISMNFFQGEHDELFVFEDRNIIKWYRDESLLQNTKINGEFKMIEAVKGCRTVNDAFVMMYLTEEKGYPYILNQKDMEKFFENQDPNDFFHQYDQKIIYNEDQLIPYGIIDAISLHHGGKMVVLATRTNRIVFLKVVEENSILHIMPMLIIYEQQPIISIDFHGERMVYLTDSGAVAYDKILRKRIGKKLRFTGETKYQWVKWTEDGSGIIYGTRKSVRSKLYVKQLIFD